MNPDFPFDSEDKRTFWQKILTLPLKLKIAIAIIVAFSAVGVAVVAWYSSISPPITTPRATEPRHANETADHHETPQAEEGEKEKEEEKKAAEKPPQSLKPSETSPIVTSPPPSTPPSSTPPPPSNGSTRPNSSNTGSNGTLTTTYSGGVSNSSSNVTYENMNFPAPSSPGYYIFSGNNLTFRNCHIRAAAFLFRAITLLSSIALSRVAYHFQALIVLHFDTMMLRILVATASILPPTQAKQPILLFRTTTFIHLPPVAATMPMIYKYVA